MEKLEEIERAILFYKEVGEEEEVERLEKLREAVFIAEANKQRKQEETWKISYERIQEE